MAGNPHDRFVKDVFARQECAAAHFRAFLPAAVRADLDLGTLELVSGSFVDEALREHHTDLLYRVRARDEEAFVYLLFEHQSTVEPMLALRVLRYVMRIWARWQDDHPGCHALPPVVPMVLYNGESPWTAPTDVRQLQASSATRLRGVLAHAPSAGFVLVELSAVDDARLHALARQGAALAGLALLTLKHVRSSDLLAHFARWGGLLRAVYREPGSGLQAFQALLRYVLEANGDVEAAALGTTLGAHTSERMTDMAISTADRLRDEGRAEGRAQGVAEGARAILLRMLRARFGTLPEGVVERIRSGSLEDVHRWSERIFHARAPADVFAAPS